MKKTTMATILIGVLLLSGCAPKYVSPPKNTKNTAQLILPKTKRIGAFGKSPYINMSKTDSKGCSKEHFILSVKEEKSTITVPANEYLIFSITLPGYLSTCYVNIATKLSPNSTHELQVGSCSANIKNTKIYQINSHGCVMQ